jgi:hypothetical protein
MPRRAVGEPRITSLGTRVADQRSPSIAELGRAAARQPSPSESGLSGGAGRTSDRIWFRAHLKNMLAAQLVNRKSVSKVIDPGLGRSLLRSIGAGF